ncbi:Transcriptional regulatory protein LiaR [Pseudoclavibacter triregionum]|nr:Transcriptional regulatory protein LiaR [Pseudoclavibacter triregionum]
MSIRVLVVDDHPIVRGGIAALVDDEPGLELVGEAPDGETAVRIAPAVRPDVVLMDLRMPGMGGAAATAELLEAEAPPRVLILTTYETDDEILSAIEAGASGYLLKDAPADDIVEAIGRVHAGEVALAPRIAARLVAQTRASRAGRGSGHRAPADPAQADAAGSATGSHGSAIPPVTLSEREREVLALVAEGCSNAEIGRRLYIGEATVKTHLAKSYEKLGVNDRTSAVLRALDLGLLAR